MASDMIQRALDQMADGREVTLYFDDGSTPGVRTLRGTIVGVSHIGSEGHITFCVTGMPEHLDKLIYINHIIDIATI